MWFSNRASRSSPATAGPLRGPDPRRVSPAGARRRDDPAVLVEAASARWDRVYPPDDPEVGAVHARVRCLSEWMPELGLPAIGEQLSARAGHPALTRSLADVRKADGSRRSGRGLTPPRWGAIDRQALRANRRSDRQPDCRDGRRPGRSHRCWRSASRSCSACGRRRAWPPAACACCCTSSRPNMRTRQDYRRPGELLGERLSDRAEEAAGRGIRARLAGGSGDGTARA